MHDTWIWLSLSLSKLGYDRFNIEIGVTVNIYVVIILFGTKSGSQSMLGAIQIIRDPFSGLSCPPPTPLEHDFLLEKNIYIRD